MDWTEGINLLVAVLLYAPVSVLLTQLIKRQGWDPSKQRVVALAVALLIGLAGTWVSGDLLGLIDAWHDMTATSLIAFVALVWGSAQLWYTLYFGKLDWMQALGAFPEKLGE